MRAVIDTNVWVSALLNPKGAPARLLRAYRDGRFAMVRSEPLLAELLEVLQRPRLAHRYGVTAQDAADLVAALRTAGLVVAVSDSVHICRDPDDDLVVEMRGQAETLVSRDEELTRSPDLAEYCADAGIAVMSVAQFLQHLGAGA